MHAIFESARLRAEEFVNDTGSVVAFQITSGAAHTDGSWTDIVASTDHDAQGYFIVVAFPAAAQQGLVDIAIGLTNEDEILSDFLIDFGRADNHTYVEYVPGFIPSGSGISARYRANGASQTIRVGIVLVDAPTQGDRYLSDVETIGVDTTGGSGASSGRVDTGGSQVDPGGSANTWGAWKELTAGTTYPFRHFMMSVGYLLNTNLTSAARWRLQIGIGASGQEQVVWEAGVIEANTTSDIPMPATFNGSITGSSGARVCVRASCNITDTVDRLIQVAMYLFRDAGR